MKKRRQGDWWTIVFLNREGFPTPIHPGPRRFLTDRVTEREIVKEVEDVMISVGRGNPEDVGLTSAAYVAGIWRGKHENFPGFIEEIRPRFYIYENGHTDVLG